MRSNLFIKVFLGFWLITIAVAPAMAQGPVDSPLRSYADVAEMAMPAVVNISTDKLVDNNFQHPFLNDPMFRRFFNICGRE